MQKTTKTNNDVSIKLYEMMINSQWVVKHDSSTLPIIQINETQFRYLCDICCLRCHFYSNIPKPAPHS